MINQTFSSFNNQTQQQDLNSLLSMWNQIRNSSNPNAAMQTLVFNNPNFQNMMTYINQSGGNAKNAFYNLAAQKGVDPNSILNLLK